MHVAVFGVVSESYGADAQRPLDVTAVQPHRSTAAGDVAACTQPRNLVASGASVRAMIEVARQREAPERVMPIGRRGDPKKGGPPESPPQAPSSPRAGFCEASSRLAFLPM